MANRPAPELDITPELVRGLLLDQRRDLADLAITELSRGWDNTNLRLGDDLIVRVPHRQVAVELVINEQRWLPVLAPRLDLALPVPRHAGRPTATYPWHWSITPWLAGVEAARAELTDPATTARRLGEFFRRLHVPAPTAAPLNPFRGGPLAGRSKSFERHLARLPTDYDARAARAVFEQASDQAMTIERVWLHGDLHTRNMVVCDGDLSAIIDWGDICAGDRATDLAGAFMLVPDHIDIVAEHAGADEIAWHRARGWSVNFAVVYLANSDDDETQRAIGERLLDTLLSGW